ncbi:MAG: PASTA domain-containing protein [bacterium]
MTVKWRTGVRTSLLYLVSIVAGFVLAYLIVAFFIFPSGVVPRDVKVPNVTGLMFDDAVQRLVQAGFRGEQGEQRYNNSAPKSTVLEQTPPPGSKEPVGATVTLAVSGGQRLATVPALAGMSKIEAQLLLEKEGFDVGETTESPSDAPRGSVIGSRPVAGARVNVPGTVSLVLSDGGTALVMPDLVGRDVDAAKQTLTQLGVKDIKIVYDAAAVGPKGAIVGQSPVPNATMFPGSSVQLRVVGDGSTP